MSVVCVSVQKSELGRSTCASETEIEGKSDDDVSSEKTESMSGSPAVGLVVLVVVVAVCRKHNLNYKLTKAYIIRISLKERSNPS
jgi:hypothetical protein